MKFSERWNDWSQRYANLSMRERVLVLGTAAIAVLLLGWGFLIDPVLKRADTLEEQIASLGGQHSQLEEQARTLQMTLARDPNRPLRQRQERLEGELDALDRRLEELSAQLVSPEGMVELLKRMLQQHGGLKLQAVQHFPPHRIDLASDDQDSEESRAEGEPALGLYAHEVELTLSGDYFAVLKYLQALEAMDKRLVWRGFSYQVQQWPEAEVHIRVQTVSLHKEWLGV
ncbi:type II secretion system protein GspM [Marinobacteraceae bacterium S3BR75-40.1]